MKELIATILMEARFNIHRACGNFGSSRQGFFILVVQPELNRYYSGAAIDRF